MTEPAATMSFNGQVFDLKTMMKVFDPLGKYPHLALRMT
jgi:hypothetical protein